MVFRKRAGMTLSVSMFCIGIGAAMAVSVVNGSMVSSAVLSLSREAGEVR